MEKLPENIERRLHVNWADGMKISKDHFVHLENAFYYNILDVAKLQLTTFNYGIFPATTIEKKSLIIECSTQATITEINVVRCFAITKEGCLIDVSPKVVDALKLESSLQYRVETQSLAGDYFLILKVDPFTHIPVAEPDPKETPPRHPYVVNKYELSLLSANDVNLNHLGLYLLPVAKLTLREGKLITDENYVPPCASIMSHDVLRSMYEKIIKILVDLRMTGFQIVRKKDNPQTLILAKNIKTLIEKISFFIGDITLPDNNLFEQLPPLLFVQQIERLITLKESILNCLSDADKESMLTYFKELYKEFNLNTNVDLKYNHENIAGSYKNILLFTGNLYTLFKELNAPPYLGGGRIRLDVKKEY